MVCFQAVWKCHIGLKWVKASKEGDDLGFTRRDFLKSLILPWESCYGNIYRINFNIIDCVTV